MTDKHKSPYHGTYRLMRRPSRPAPAPKTAMGRRLEEVRAHTGYPSLRSFWARLDEGWEEEDGRVSYEAARNYHYDRAPPVSYLVRVSDVFNVSLEWLATEKGPFEGGPPVEDYVARAFGATNPEDSDQAFRMYTAFHEGAGGKWKEDSDGQRRMTTPLPLSKGGSSLVLLIGLWLRRQLRPRLAGEAVSPEDKVESARELGRAIMAPIEALGVQPGAGYRFFLIEHIEAMVPVLRRVIEYEDRGLAIATTPEEERDEDE